MLDYQRTDEDFWFGETGAKNWVDYFLALEVERIRYGTNLRWVGKRYVAQELCLRSKSI